MNFGAVEAVTAGISLVGERRQIAGDDGCGVVSRAESFQLGMMRIAFRESLENLLCEKPFAPGCKEPFHVEISGMKRPQSHISSDRGKQAFRQEEKPGTGTELDDTVVFA